MTCYRFWFKNTTLNTLCSIVFGSLTYVTYTVPQYHVISFNLVLYGIIAGSYTSTWDGITALYNYICFPCFPTSHDINGPESIIDHEWKLILYTVLTDMLERSEGMGSSMFQILLKPIISKSCKTNDTQCRDKIFVWIFKGILNIPHKISYPYNERYIFLPQNSLDLFPSW